jgi:long-chain acyl-CoA synthetase
MYYILLERIITLHIVDLIIFAGKIIKTTIKMQNIKKNGKPTVNKDGKPVIVRDIIAQSAEKYASLTAYLYRGEQGGEYRSKTYSETWDDIVSMGVAMTALGLKGKKIAIIGENCYPWIVTYLAAVSGNIVAVPLGTELGEEAIHNLIGIAECEALFYTERFDAIAANANVTHKIRMNRYADSLNPKDCFTWNEMLEKGHNLPESEREVFKNQDIDPDAMSLLMFTSGTTGKAKGVMLSTSHVGHNVWDMEQAHNIKQGDITVSILPIYHIFEAVMGQHFMLAHGVTIAFSDGIKYLKKDMADAGATVQLLVPLLVENFYKTVWSKAKKNGKEEDLKARIAKYKKIREDYIKEHGTYDDSEPRKIARAMFADEIMELGGKLEHIFTGAAAVDSKYIRGLQDIGIKVINGYGSTEAGCLISSVPCFSDTYGTAGSVGPVTPSGELSIKNPDDDGVGEVLYRGPCVLKGYYNMPEQTAQALQGGWYHTGDYGFLNDRGWLYLTGRKNNIIVTKTGKNIYPEELEFELSKNPYINELMVYGSPDAVRGGMAVSVQIRPNYDEIKADKGDMDAAATLKLMKEIVAEFNSTIANYKRIRAVYIRDTEFVKTATSKLMRQASIDTYGGRAKR